MPRCAKYQSGGWSAAAQFVAGSDATFHIVEQQVASAALLPALEWIYEAVGRPRSRRVTLRGRCVDDSCEWAIAIREVMAAAQDKG